MSEWGALAVKVSAPPIHGQTAATSAALVTVVLYLASLDNITVPGVVASAITTLVSVALGYGNGKRKAKGA